MIKVESITIKEFRGIRDLTLNLKGKNFAVCGPNGTGKSGIVDALEFALTGNISRLSGKGTGDVSLKEHAPHVDSRNRPDKAKVILNLSIPSINKKVLIERDVSNPNSPKVVPADADVIEILNKVSSHPEFVLSRRELIRYVISAPGDRAKEVQALLRLDQVEELRQVLQKIANATEREIEPLKRVKTQSIEQLEIALEISQLTDENILAAVNKRRVILGLTPLNTLAATTSLKDGLATIGTSIVINISKAAAINDIKNIRKVIGDIVAADIKDLLEKLTLLKADASMLDGMTKEKFLRTALEIADGEACPVCDRPWSLADLQKHIREKLAYLEEISKKRTAIEGGLRPFLTLESQFRTALLTIERHGKALGGSTKVIEDLVVTITSQEKQLSALLPLDETINALKQFASLPPELSNEIAEVEKLIVAMPEPTQQDAARDYLTVSQERLEIYRAATLNLKQAEEKSVIARSAYDIYAKVSTSTLDGIYKEVEKDFSELYRFINKDDEGQFEARLEPSIGKLGFDVDFYGRGFFPPGAYHSEGHQDGMGLCLYLALMKHLSGDAFTFAVLDDVLMSVDAGHRREVCNLLKEQFSNTQFILTTHDRIWLQHMKIIGLVNSSAQFRKWDVDHGPTEWDDRDVWQEIDGHLKSNQIREAAALLRYYLEHVSAEFCDQLRASVEFHSDAQFQLGDLLPRATVEFSKSLQTAKTAATSWGKTDEVKILTDKKDAFDKAVTESGLEQWQTNAAVHYNNWENLQKNDFAPVVEAHHKLVDLFSCPTCKGIFHITPSRGGREVFKCDCTSFNLTRKSQ